jgi:hypothetical protein
MRERWRSARVPGRRHGAVLARWLLPAVAASGVLAASAAAHHVGVYVPRDNEVTANFKQLKFAMGAERFDVALQLFDEGAVRVEMRAQAARLPEGLEAATRAAIVARDTARAERGLMVFFAALARDLALVADRQLADQAIPPPDRAAAAWKLLEAIWRYYNLVDYTVGQYDAKAAAGIRLAYDDAESLLRGPAGPSPPPTWWGRLWTLVGLPAAAPVTSGAAREPERQGAPDPERARAPVSQIAHILGGLVEKSAPSARRPS